MAKKEINLGELQDLIAQGPAGQAKLKKQAEAISTLQQTLMLMYKRQKPYEVPVKMEDNAIKFAAIGDTQFGSLYGHRDALRAFYNRAADEGVNMVLHTGDVLDGWKVYRGQEFELRPDGKSWPEQRDIFAREVPQIPSMTTIFITGNHDASFKNLVGMNVGDELQRARDDWKFIGQDVGDVELQTKSGLKYRVRLLHPGGGTAYAVSYNAQKIIESMPGGQKPSLICIGHYHKGLYMPQYRNVSCLLTGCFQAQTPFMARQSIAAHVGGWIVTVHLTDPKKLTTRMSAEFISFFEEKQ